MFNRMTVWAQHFKIGQIVISSVAVFVMHTKNFRMFGVSTPHALSQHAPHEHVLANGRKIGPPFAFARFIDASSRTVFSFCRRRVHKSCAAVRAAMLYGAFFVHCFVIALGAAVFSLVGAARNVLKNSATFRAIRGYLLPGVECHTLAATKRRRVFAVLRHSEDNLTMLARFFVPNSGANHATH